MHARGEVVRAITAREMFVNFNRWLEECNIQNAVLVAHNGRKFDFPALMNSLNSLELGDDFCSRIIAFVDSLPLLKIKVPGRNTYSLGAMVNDILNAEYDAHDALAVSLMLKL